MSIDLDRVVPWGRNLDEYTRMFALTGDDLRRRRRVLDAAGGPASFNAELYDRGVRVTSADPLYAYDVADIRRRIDQTYPTIVEGARRDAHRFVWSATGVRDPDHLGRLRAAAMDRFLEDFPQGRQEGRYLPQSLPALAFADRAFDLALCSHFLFLYTDQLGLEFHHAALAELCRVAREVRVFPLLDMHSRPSTHLPPVTAALAAAGHAVEIVKVAYEFQKGADHMLVIRPRRGYPGAAG